MVALNEENKSVCFCSPLVIPFPAKTYSRRSEYDVQLSDEGIT